MLRLPVEWLAEGFDSLVSHVRMRVGSMADATSVPVQWYELYCNLHSTGSRHETHLFCVNQFSPSNELVQKMRHWQQGSAHCTAKQRRSVARFIFCCQVIGAVAS